MMLFFGHSFGFILFFHFIFLFFFLFHRPAIASKSSSSKRRPNPLLVIPILPIHTNTALADDPPTVHYSLDARALSTC